MTTLIGFDGSYLCSTDRPCSYGDISNIGHELSTDFLSRGSISLVPEPSTLALIGTGVFIIAGTVRRRFRL